MDKATKVAVEKYPHGTFDGEIGDSLRAACAVGYMQAEKDKETEEKHTRDNVLTFIITISLVILAATAILCYFIEKDVDETVAWFTATLWCFESLILNRKK